MDDCVNGLGNTGARFRTEGGELIGKTGTSQIADERSGGYIEGTENVITSFSGVYPKSNPQIIIYVAAKKPTGGDQRAISVPVKEVVQNVSKYYGNQDTKTNLIVIKDYKVDNFINKKVDKAKTTLETNEINYIILGNGNKVIKQTPEANTKVTNKDTVYLITNDPTITIPDVTGLSSKVAKSLLEELGLNVKLDGTGYVTSQSIAPFTAITKGQEIILVLNPKFQ